jgi:sugar/nucleoside kinase (ribokinase family)
MQEALGINLSLGTMAQILPSLVKHGLVRGAVTDGKRGAFVWEGSSSMRVPPGRVVQRRDVVGAGDGFLAGWLAGFHRRLPFTGRARFAASCGEEVARHGIFGFRTP